MIGFKMLVSYLSAVSGSHFHLRLDCTPVAVVPWALGDITLSSQVTGNFVAPMLIFLSTPLIWREGKGVLWSNVNSVVTVSRRTLGHRCNKVIFSTARWSEKETRDNTSDELVIPAGR